MYINTLLVIHQTHTMRIAGECCPHQPLFLPRCAFWTKTKWHCVLHELSACSATTKLCGALRGMATLSLSSSFSFSLCPNASCTGSFPWLADCRSCPSSWQECSFAISARAGCATCASFDDEMHCRNKESCFFFLLHLLLLNRLS